MLPLGLCNQRFHVHLRGTGGVKQVTRRCLLDQLDNQKVAQIQLPTLPHLPGPMCLRSNHSQREVLHLRGTASALEQLPEWYVGVPVQPWEFGWRRGRHKRGRMEWSEGKGRSSLQEKGTHDDLAEQLLLRVRRHWSGSRRKNEPNPPVWLAEKRVVQNPGVFSECFLEKQFLLRPNFLRCVFHLRRHREHDAEDPQRLHPLGSLHSANEFPLRVGRIPHGNQGACNVFCDRQKHESSVPDRGSEFDNKGNGYFLYQPLFQELRLQLEATGEEDRVRVGGGK